MKKLVCVKIRGKVKNWWIEWYATDAQIAGMRLDGIEVDEVVNSVPAWVASFGMTRVWCFFQDLINFNFRK